MPEQAQHGWSPNPIFNSVHAVAPTPLGAQAQALMSPLPAAPMPVPAPAPIQLVPMPRPLRMHKRMPGTYVYGYGSPGPAQSMFPGAPPGRFEHYVPSVRYQPVGTEVDFDEEDDEFVLVEEKERVPKDGKVGKRAIRVEPNVLFKGVKNMFNRNPKQAAQATDSFPPGFLPQWPTSPFPLHHSIVPSSHTLSAASPGTRQPTALPYSQGYFSPRSGMSQPMTSYHNTPIFGLMSPVADPRTVFNALRSPDPNRAPGVPSHPPPKPPEWSMPDHSRPSWACQLNPLLVHHAAGIPLVHFDLRLPPSAITLLRGTPTALTDEDRTQHATWPALAELVITSVADEPLFAPTLGLGAAFPWAIRTSNPGGVTCGDVWTALAEAVMLHVRPGEYASLSPARKEQVKLSYWARCASDLPVEEGAPPRPGPDDGCRRIDVLGTRIMFRGLEPAPAVDGSWVMFLGPP